LSGAFHLALNSEKHSFQANSLLLCIHAHPINILVIFLCVEGDPILH
jgi:hypothetical protein